MSPINKQIGGSHYKDLLIQPAEYCVANKLGALEGLVIKYITRWRKRGGYEDLEKAKHTIELLIELEEKYASVPSAGSIQSPEVEPKDSFKTTYKHVGYGSWINSFDDRQTQTSQGTKKCQCTCGSNEENTKI